MPIAEVDQQQTLEVEVWLFGPPERQGHARWQCVRAGVQPRVFPSSEHPFQQTEWQDYGQAIARLWWAWLRPLDPGTSPQEK